MKHPVRSSRRSFITQTAVGLVLTPQIAARASPAKGPKIAKGLEEIALEGPMGRVFRTPGDQLMAWFVEGKKWTKEEERKGKAQEVINNPTIPERAFARYSADHGYNWSEPQLLFDFPREKGTYGGGIALSDRDGVIHLFGLHYFGTGPDGFSDWDNARSFVYHVMSPDAGKTWTRPHHCDFGYLYTGATNSVIQLKSGRILLPVSYFSRRKTGRFVSNLSISDDGGKTWRPSRGQCAVDTGGPLLESGACEPVCLELEDGRVWMLIRTQGGYQYESFSDDGGDSWSEPAPSRFISSNAPSHLLRLRDGRVVFAWNNCMSPYHEEGILTSYDRQILAMAISSDEGTSWRGYREIRRIREGERQVSYPFLTEAGDGTILLMTSGNRMIRVQPDWLTEDTFTEDFEEGLANWMTIGCEGAEIVPHPNRSQSKVLALRKRNRQEYPSLMEQTLGPSIPVAASLNFPFGVRGEINMRLFLEPGFRDASYHRVYYHLCLTDFFFMPRLPSINQGWPVGQWELFPQSGRFALRISPDGRISAGTDRGLFQTQYLPTRAALNIGEWHDIDLKWDCQKENCLFSLDGQRVADLPQLSPCHGVCYLRLWSQGNWRQQEGVLIESVKVRVQF